MIYNWKEGECVDYDLTVLLNGKPINTVFCCCTGRHGWIIQSLERLKPPNFDEVETKSYYGNVQVVRGKIGR